MVITYPTHMHRQRQVKCGLFSLYGSLILGHLPVVQFLYMGRYKGREGADKEVKKIMTGHQLY